MNRNGKGKAWSEEEDDTLINSTLTAKETGILLGRSTHAINKRRQTLGITRHRQTHNEYIFHEDYVEIVCQSSVFGTNHILVDRIDFDKVKEFTWRVIKKKERQYSLRRNLKIYC